MGKSRNTRFIDRVFTLDEQNQIFSSSDPDTILWALWAGKEAAYKVIRKYDSNVSSTPRLYKVTLFPVQESEQEARDSSGAITLSGVVDTPYEKVHIRIFITRDYVHCIGTTSAMEDIDSLAWHVDRISPDSEASPGNESMLVRKALKKHLSAYVKHRPEDMEIRREKECSGLGPPFVYFNDRLAEIDISLSHDGMFTAHAFII